MEPLLLTYWHDGNNDPTLGVDDTGMGELGNPLVFQN